MQSYPNIFQIRFHFVKYLQSYVSLLSNLNALGLCCNAVIKLLPGIPASHTGAFFANLLLSFRSCFLLVYVAYVHGSHTHMPSLDGVLGSCLWPGPAWAIAIIWRVNHLMEELCISLSLTLLL